jgi:hypothetical protein
MGREYDLRASGLADLLCYLVVSQLVCHAQTGEWLRTHHLVESSRVWVASSKAECGWIERVEIGLMSAGLASQFLAFPMFNDTAALAGLFKDGLQLDSRSPVVKGIYDVCNDHLYRGK